MIVAFTGSRQFNNMGFLIACVQQSFARFTDDKSMKWVFGDAIGLDALVWRLAREWVIPYERMIADWDGKGRSAGPLRNTDILNWEPHVLLAFPMSGSIGTWDMIEQTARFNKRRKFLHQCRIEIYYAP